MDFLINQRDLLNEQLKTNNTEEGYWPKHQKELKKGRSYQTTKMGWTLQNPRSKEECQVLENSKIFELL